MLIQLAADTCDTTASLQGQGDDQAILLKNLAQAELEIREVIEDVYMTYFIHVLTNYAEPAGIHVKPQDTW